MTPEPVKSVAGSELGHRQPPKEVEVATWPGAKKATVVVCAIGTAKLMDPMAQMFS